MGGLVECEKVICEVQLLEIIIVVEFVNCMVECVVDVVKVLMINGIMVNQN